MTKSCSLECYFVGIHCTNVGILAKNNPMMWRSSEEIDVCVWHVNWQMYGHHKICEKWMRPIITKVLINTGWIIDNNAGKSADMDPEQWKTLVAMRATEAMDNISMAMDNIWNALMNYTLHICF